MNKISYGYASATSGALIWGMAPLYYHLLNEFPLMEVVAQRAFWSCVLFMVVFIIQNRLSELRLALTSFKNISPPFNLTILEILLAISPNPFLG